MTEGDAERFVERRRARNRAVFLALLGLVVLFYLITLARRSAGV